MDLYKRKSTVTSLMGFGEGMNLITGSFYWPPRRNNQADCPACHCHNMPVAHQQRTARSKLQRDHPGQSYSELRDACLSERVAGGAGEHASDNAGVHTFVEEGDGGG